MTCVRGLPGAPRPWARALLHGGDMACAAGEGCPEFVLSGCRFGKRVLAHGRWPVASVSEWPGSPGSSIVACRRDLARIKERDTRSDAARPRGFSRPSQVVRGDRRGCRERLRVQPTCLRARHPPPLPGHTASRTSVGSRQQACQNVILCRIHAKPRLCE